MIASLIHPFNIFTTAIPAVSATCISVAIITFIIDPRHHINSITLPHPTSHNRDTDFNNGDGCLPPNIIGLKGVIAAERPLVHVFLIQESMPLDALIAVS